MLLLTWHGTILRVEQSNRRLTHAAPVPVRDIGIDFSVDLPPQLTAPVPLPGGMEAIPAARPGTIHLRRGDAYLAVEPFAPFPLCNRKQAATWETLLPIAEDEAATLRRLLEGAWTLAHDGQEVPAGSLRLAENFTLMLGDHALDLTTQRPTLGEAGSIILLLPAGRLTLRPRPSAPPPGEWSLHPAPPGHQAREVTSTAELHATANSRLTLPGPPERVHLPITGRPADSAWLYKNPWNGHEPAWGQRQFDSQAVHETDKFVLLERFVEGMIFGPHGVTNTHGYLGNFTAALPPNMARESEHTFISTAALHTAPKLRGPHAVFYGGNLTNYFHWIIDAMVPLSLLHPHLPPDTTLLLPGTLAQFRANPNGRFDHIETLQAFGFGDMKRVEIDAQLCHVEDIYWTDKCFIDEVSAAALDAARNRALHRLPPAGPATRKIYIRRTTTRRVANEADIETLMRQMGFETHVMETLTVAEQIELFRHAAFVIGVHGAALANLVFCPPGTKVIELSPECGYRPFFALISSKLGLLHGILPCPSLNGEFFGNLRVDAGRLRALRRMLEQRL